MTVISLLLGGSLPDRRQSQGPTRRSRLSHIADLSTVLGISCSLQTVGRTFKSADCSFNAHYCSVPGEMGLLSIRLTGAAAAFPAHRGESRERGCSYFSVAAVNIARSNFQEALVLHCRGEGKPTQPRLGGRLPAPAQCLQVDCRLCACPVS